MPVAVHKDRCLLSYCLDVAVQGLLCLHCIFKTTVELSRTVTLGLESLILQLCSWIILWIWLVSLDAWITADFKPYDEKPKSYFWIYSSFSLLKQCFPMSNLWPIQVKKNNKRKYSHILRMLKCLGQVIYRVEKWNSKSVLKDTKKEMKNFSCAPKRAE